MLEITSLACARGAVQVLQNVDLTLCAGEAVVLRGPNGAGKTTLLRIIAGLAPALSGQISCASDSIAYSGHADGIKTSLTVAQNLNFGAGVFG